MFLEVQPKKPQKIAHKMVLRKYKWQGLSIKCLSFPTFNYETRSAIIILISEQVLLKSVLLKALNLVPKYYEDQKDKKWNSIPDCLTLSNEVVMYLVVEKVSYSIRGLNHSFREKML